MSIYQSIRNLASSLSLLLLITACSTSHGNVISSPPPEKQVFTAVSFEQAELNQPIPTEYQQMFRNALKERLVDTGHFESGDGLIIRYQWLSFEQGSRLKRWLLSGSSGRASVRLRITYTDSTGETLAETEVEGAIKLGAFGGSFNKAVENAAEHASRFAVRNFK